MSLNEPEPGVISQAEAAAAKGDFAAARGLLITARLYLDDRDNFNTTTDAGKAEFRKAIELAGNVDIAIGKIDNMQLSQLVGRAKADLEELQVATADVNKAIAEIKQTTAILTTVTSLIGIIGRFLPMV